MICLGNICRSPLAEGILRSKLPSHYTVDSAGTANYHVGDSPDYRSVSVAKNHGIDISFLRGRQFTVADFDSFDVLYVMDSSNYQNIISLARNEEDLQKVFLLMNEEFPNENREVPDPYYGNEEDFEVVYQQLDSVCTLIAKKYQS